MKIWLNLSDPKPDWETFKRIGMLGLARWRKNFKKNLDAKNISISVLSPELNIEQTIKLNDRNFKDIGNTKNSTSYKETLKNIFKDTINIVKAKVLNNNLFDKLEKFDPKKIEDKVKDKLKNKLKKLIN